MPITMEVDPSDIVDEHVTVDLVAELPPSLAGDGARGARALEVAADLRGAVRRRGGERLCVVARIRIRKDTLQQMRQRLRAFGVRGDHVRLGERVARGQSAPR